MNRELEVYSTGYTNGPITVQVVSQSEIFAAGISACLTDATHTSEQVEKPLVSTTLPPRAIIVEATSARDLTSIVEDPCAGVGGDPSVAVGLRTSLSISQISILTGCGFHALLSNEHTADELRCGVAAALAGNYYIQARLLSARIGVSTIQSVEVCEDLTERELEVLRGLARGESDAEIAVALSVGRRTVRFHLSNIFGKFRVSNRQSAVVCAFHRGII